MPTDEQYKKLIRQLQEEMHRLDDEITSRDEKLHEQANLIKQSIMKSEHENIVTELRREYEYALSENNLRHKRIHNERGAGRKSIASRAVASRVLELSAQGLSQEKIALKVADEFNMKIKRTTVGEIVRGNYKPLDKQ